MTSKQDQLCLLALLTSPPWAVTLEKYFPSRLGQDKLRSAPIPPTAVAAI